MSKVVNISNLIQQRIALETRLFQVQRMEAIGQLAGSVANDLGDLLATLLVRLDQAQRRLSEESGTSQEIDAYERVAERTVTLANSVRDLLQKLDAHPVTFDVRAAVNGFLGQMGCALGRSIQIEVVHSPVLWVTEADPAQMQNALLALLINAREAMPHGGRITITTRNERVGNPMREAGPTDYVAISVADTGVGMSREVRERACEPFFTTKSAGKGSGLGLSLVQGFVRRSGGLLQIDSEVGRGTSVHLYLRRASRPENELVEPDR